MFNLGDNVKLVNGSNVYKVVNKYQNSIELHCIDFQNDECLQNGINCYSYNQLVWVNVNKSDLELVK